MATSGSIEYVRSGIFLGIGTCSLSWSRTSYSIRDNKSTISVVFKVYSNVSSGGFADFAYMFDVDGNEYTGKLPANLSQGWNTIRSVSLEIPHNTDGTKGFDYSVRCQINGASNEFGGASGYSTLNAIPRQATISSAVDFNDEGNPTITYVNTSGESVDSLEACISFTGATDDVPYRAISKTGNSYTFNLTYEERQTLRRGITSGNSATVRFYVRTKIETETYWSYITKTLTLINYQPVITPTVIDSNSTTSLLTGNTNKLIRYHSNARVYFNAFVYKEATIAKQKVTNGAQTFETTDSSVTSTVINNVADNVFTVSVTDSRGYTASQQVQFKGDNFIPYFDVSCAQSIRLNLDKTIDLTVKGNYYNGSFGAKDNELIVEVRHREDGGEWTSWEAIMPLVSDISGNTYSLNATISGYNPSGSYDFQCRAKDKLSVAESAIETVTLEPLFDWGRNDFNFNVPVSFEGNTLVDFVVEEGTDIMGTNGTWYWCKWKSGKAECYGCRNYGNTAVSTAWGGLYRSTTFSQSLPSGLFKAAPDVINISLRGGSYGGWVVRHEESAPSSSSSGSFIVVRPASATISQAYISFHIIGRWK